MKTCSRIRSVHSQLASAVLLFLIATSVLLQDAAAQQPTMFGDYEVVGASYRKFVLPGESSIRVLVLGSVGAGGIYEVGRGTDLGRLLALTGGSFVPESSEQLRRLTLRVLRTNGTRRDLVYEASLDDFLVDPGSYPVLQDGDVFLIETRLKNRFQWRDALSIVTGIAALTLAADRIINVTR